MIGKGGLLRGNQVGITLHRRLFGLLSVEEKFTVIGYCDRLGSRLILNQTIWPFFKKL